MKKAIALLVAAMLLTGLSACGGSTTADAPAKSDGTSKTETNKEEPKPQPADLTGTWKQTNSNDPSSYMEATISGDTIEVDWIGTDTKSLYWKGTYQAPAAAGDWKWTSQGVLLDFGLSFIESRLHAVVVTARLELRRAIYSFYHSGCAHPSKLMDALVRGLYFGR